MPTGLIAALGSETAREGARLRILGEEAQQTALAAVVEAGNYAISFDPSRADEQTKWAPGPRSDRRDGVPATAYLAKQERVEPSFPDRDYAHGRGWGLPPAGEGQIPRSAGVVAILTTSTDQPHDWISAGQALQRTLLYASSCGLTTALHTQPLEIPSLREFIRTQLCEGAYPQLVLRFGASDQAEVSVRRAVDDVLL